MRYEVAIIGGGIVGTAILNKLTRLGKKCVLIEKNSDVATGTTKANSGIVHAGFDAKEGTLKAKLNVRGANLFPKLCEELKVPFIKNGALVIGNDKVVVEKLYNRGIANGVKGLHILNRDELLVRLPNITDNITCGLFAETSAIVSPYKMAIALAEESVINGASVVFNYNTIKIEKIDDCYLISNGKDIIYAEKIVVAVGGEHNELASRIGLTQYDIKYRRGEYYLLDRNAMDIGGYTIFPLPSENSKGVLVSSTVDNNIIIGPTSTPTDTNDTITTSIGLKEIALNSSLMLNNINLKKNIRVFSGVRTLVNDDFVIEEDKKFQNIINVTGICSPGLTASPAIAEMICEMFGYKNEEIEIKHRDEYPSINSLCNDELNELIKKESRYGKIVCRCEQVSEMEIINAINSPLKPISLDAIKRRTRAGMGRCQGGFCFLKVMEIIAREHNMDIDKVIKENSNSRIIIGDIK